MNTQTSFVSCKIRIPVFWNFSKASSYWERCFLLCAPSESFANVSSENQILTESPWTSRSLPVAFLSFRTMFFLRSILYRKPESALGRMPANSLSSLFPASFVSIINSFIYEKKRHGVKTTPAPLLSVSGSNGNRTKNGGKGLPVI